LLRRFFLTDRGTTLRDAGFQVWTVVFVSMKTEQKALPAMLIITLLPNADKSGIIFTI
jgi:hypothetical protein